MIVDDAGLIWISNLWLALGFLLIVLGLTLFSHGWVATGRAPRPRQMAVRIRRRRTRVASAPVATPVNLKPTQIVGWRTGKVSRRRSALLPSRRLVA
jgi:hypothetical protein